jgi:hypothetical protein
MDKYVEYLDQGTESMPQACRQSSKTGQKTQRDKKTRKQRNLNIEELYKIENNHYHDYES